MTDTHDRDQSSLPTTTHPTAPPQRGSNEADPDQLKIADAEGTAYRKALEAMAEQDGAVTCRAGDYLVAFVNEKAEGMYAVDGDRLVWREAAADATVHLEVAVADAGDGRFVPALEVRLDIEHNGRVLVSTELPFLWHPFLHHYGTNAVLPGEGPYDVTVHIGVPTFMRHDPVNGKRYAEAVTARFENVRFVSGRKASPDAQPRGPEAPTAGAEREVGPA